MNSLVLLASLSIVIAISSLQFDVVHSATNKIAFTRSDQSDGCGYRDKKANAQIVPEFYRVSLELNDFPHESYFDGSVEIDLKVSEERISDRWNENEIFIKAGPAQVEFTDAWFEKTTKKGGKRVKIVEVCYNSDWGVVKIALAEKLELGSSGKLGIAYKGHYDDFGLKNVESSNDIKVGSHVFPCFEDVTDPEYYSAPIELRVTCDRDLIVVSNQKSQHVKEIPDRRQTVHLFPATGRIQPSELLLEVAPKRRAG